LEEQQEQVTERIVNALDEAGFRGISNDELVDALDQVSVKLTEQQDIKLGDLSVEMNTNLHNHCLDLTESLTQDFEADLSGLREEHIEPLRIQIANQPDPVINQVTHRHVTNVSNTNVTNIDDRQVVNTNNVVHDGGVLDQRIVQSDDGAIAVGGDVEDSAVNTGVVDGIQAGGDVDAEDSIVGDGNTAVIDSEIDAFAQGGDAVSIDADPSPPPAPAVEPALAEEPTLDAPPEPIDDLDTFDHAAADAAEAEAAALEAELDA